MDSAFYIKHLDLSPHPEGGFFKEVYRSAESISDLPQRYIGVERSISTSIYFLLNQNQKSHFHRIESDETWHFYQGSALLLHQIAENGDYRCLQIGSDLAGDQMLQYTVPKGFWFAAEVVDKTSFSLVGCTVAPGFDFRDFELAKFDKLSQICPDQALLIESFCLS